MKQVINMLKVSTIKYVFLILWVYMTLTLLIQIYTNYSVIYASAQLPAIEKQRQELIIENMILENKIADKSSLRHLRARALDLGYKTSPEVAFLKYEQ